MEREAVTIRFPAVLVHQAKALEESEESFNELVVDALTKEVCRRQALSAHQRIVARREAIKARTGIQPHAATIVRSLREGEARLE